MRRRLRLIVVVVVVALLGAACGSGPDDSSAPTTDASSVSPTSGDDGALLAPAEFSARIEATPSMPLVNVHVPYEGHIEGTDHFVPFDEIAEWEGLPKDLSAPLALYCRSGNMSAQAVQTLEAMGYEDVIDLEGGMNAWSQAGLDLVTDPPPSEG